jgi:hypothetical protein
MRAQMLVAFGGPENLQLVDVPKPALKSGHVLIRIAATSINPVDFRIRSGSPIGQSCLPFLDVTSSARLRQLEKGYTILRLATRYMAAQAGSRGRVVHLLK